MKVEQIYTGCLAEAAYYIESEGEVAIIDPLRESRPYIDKANANNAKIKYVLETHFHADFVSGHLELAKKTGAQIVFGPTAAPGYEAHVAADGEVLKLGKVTIVVLHTPGHTMESSTYLLRDENGKDYAVFTGDTLFIGDVGRPDLVQKLKPEVTPELLAGYLFDSLRQKIMTLADEVIVYPGHGAGSACGKKLDKETVSTVGQQKKYNYALRANMTKEEFTRELLNGLVEPPQYFPANVLMNVKGYGSVDEIIQKGLRPLALLEFEAVWESSHALVIDTRSKDVFAKGFIPGSIFIGIDDTFAPWVGALITDLMQPILIIADEGKEEEVVVRLARVGYDNPIGYLKGGINSWLAAGNSLETILEISAQDFGRLCESRSQVNVLDVRRESEFKAEHLVGAENFPLDFINRNMSLLDKNKTYYVHCAGGYRSLIAVSILKSRGYEKLVNIKGGYKALASTSLKRTEHLEVNTEL
ncbi:MAG: MBL fold metallo-hydrolase [Bacteroidetes bacterium]|nr:MBL fold metallo-hydrolase [Bacteroidota bacterium]